MQSCPECAGLSRTCEQRAQHYLEMLRNMAKVAALLPSNEFLKMREDLIAANAWHRQARNDLICHQRKCNPLTASKWRSEDPPQEQLRTAS